MSEKYFNYYVSNSGHTPKNFQKFKIPYELMKPYDLPTSKELKKTLPVFTSYFFNWSSENNLKMQKNMVSKC